MTAKNSISIHYIDLEHKDIFFATLTHRGTMQCPDCLSAMMQVTLGTKPPVRLDSCVLCGGVWADQSEINFVSYKNLTDIGIATQRIHSVHPPRIRQCPVDHNELVVYKNESIPEYIPILHCKTCGGNWFPAGSVMPYKKAQEAKASFVKLWRIPIRSAYSVLLPFVLLMVIGGGMFVTVKSIQNQQSVVLQARTLVRIPTVKRAGPDSVHISFTTTRPLRTSLALWPADKKQEAVYVRVSTTEKTVHTVLLKNLLPNSTYFYHIVMDISGKTSESNVYSFTTGKD